MTNEEREMFNRIRDYAERALDGFDTDPQKTPISFQLQKLRPVMQEIAMEKQMPVEDIFIKYMDLIIYFPLANPPINSVSDRKSECSIIIK